MSVVTALLSSVFWLQTSLVSEFGVRMGALVRMSMCGLMVQVEVQRVLLPDATVSIGQKETALMEFMISKGYRKAAELASMFKPRLNAGQKALLTLDLIFVRPEETEPISYLSL